MISFLKCSFGSIRQEEKELYKKGKKKTGKKKEKKIVRVECVLLRTLHVYWIFFKSIIAAFSDTVQRIAKNDSDIFLYTEKDGNF